MEYENNRDRNKILSIEKYLNKIRLYLKHFINDLKKSDTWGVQLTIAINFTSSKNNDDKRAIHSKSGSTEFMIYDNADEVIEELFQSLLNRYQIGLGKSMTGCDFIFD